MNLLFYDFNGSSACNTQQNFFPAGSGDRVPTRERCYRSAQQQIRKRGEAPPISAAYKC